MRRIYDEMLLNNVVLDTTKKVCIMRSMTSKIVFDWDQWNVQKNEMKHGVSHLEAESAFFDPGYKLFQDQKHSTAKELRYILYGYSIENRVLMVGFTLKKKKVRIITARQASRKERVIYGEKKSKTK
ncbi:MAG: hypothetical protein CO021_06060 [Deltaproteobacteria bacterium CG_4_9_14_0_2_um_filter_42_21]|nr:MAG: hypothetical protein CO021_06060 [Deltaproteobacteria bacterium CG_4_9_14_0_2_um_filter_42_21]